MVKRLIKMEIYQLVHSRMFYFMLFICCTMTLLFTSDEYLLEPIVQNTPNNLMGVFMNQMADVGVALIIITGCYSAYLFSEQFKQRTINLKIVCGYSRIAIYLVQCLKTFLVVGFLICFSAVVGCFKYGVENFVHAICGDAGYFFRTIIFTFFLAFSIVSFCLVFSVAFQDTTKTLIMSFIFLFISCYIMSAVVSNMLTTEDISSAYEISKGAVLKFYPPYLWRWSLNPGLNISHLITTICISLFWGIGAVGIGCCVFKRKEIK